MSTNPFPSVGETFEERYILDEVIGEGGAARVYRARQEDLSRDVAIKMLKPVHRTAQKAEEMTKRFKREAKLVSQLRDPHSITVYDYGQAESGLLYMVTEYIEGRSMHDFLRFYETVEPHDAARMIQQILFSLQEAHELGVLHRDIKPANIMVFDLVGRPNQVKVLDFGIAKAFNDSDASSDSMQVSLTAKGRVIGSPGYMSPEQIYGEELDPRSDIYSVGLVAYEMVCGERAIKSTDDLKAAHEQISSTPILLPDDAGVEPKLKAVIERMTLKDKEKRYATITEVLEDLAPCVIAQSGAAQPALENSEAELEFLDEDSEAESVPSKDGSRPNLTPVLIGAIVIAAIIMVLFFLSK